MIDRTHTIQSEPARFRRVLLDWFDAVKRDLPWRKTTDPYAVWVSEAMLQQTQVERVVGYYTRFLDRFPTVEALAAADIEEVLKAWEGLGYYARARSLHRAARVVRERFGGRLPDSFEGLLELPGFGPYTAAAVASIAFGEGRAAIDGNVSRVVSRLRRVSAPPASGAGKASIAAFASELLDPQRPGDFNQAMMELGATVCRPRAPKCGECPVNPFCAAHRNADPEAYPIRTPKPARPHVQAACAAVESDGRFLVVRRTGEKLLGGLWEFPGGRCRADETPADACRRGLLEKTGLASPSIEPFCVVDHTFTHFKVTLHAFLCRSDDPTDRITAGRWATVEELSGLPMTRTARRILEKLAGGNKGCADP